MRGGSGPALNVPCGGGGGAPGLCPRPEEGGPSESSGRVLDGRWLCSSGGSLAGASGTLCHALDVCRLALSPGQVAWALHGSSQPLFKENSTCLLKARYFPQIQL